MSKIEIATKIPRTEPSVFESSEDYKQSDSLIIGAANWYQQLKRDLWKVKRADADKKSSKTERQSKKVDWNKLVPR